MRTWRWLRRLGMAALVLGTTLSCSGTSDGGRGGAAGSPANGTGGQQGLCQPDCTNATCQNPKDTCGGECSGVCSVQEHGCVHDLHCGAGFACLADPAGFSICLPAECAFMVLEPPLCGTTGATCGDVCPACTPMCDDRRCGPDYVCGTSCGECDETSYCSGGGQCLPTGNFCEGNLALVGALIEPVNVAGESPMAAGGTVPDATFDLVEQRVYGVPAMPPQPRRESLRFYDGATGAEQLQEDESLAMSSRRTLSVSFQGGTLMTAFVDCPLDDAEGIFQRVFTINAGELWLFEKWGFSAYRQR